VSQLVFDHLFLLVFLHDFAGVSTELWFVDFDFPEV